MHKQAKRIFLKAVLSFVLALAAAVFFAVYQEYVQAFAQENLQGGLKYYICKACLSEGTWLLTLCCFPVFAVVALSEGKAAALIYRYRYLLALLFFVVCVCLEINGSSLGTWAEYLDLADTGDILGVDRPVRSDEWAVSTPMMLSQYYNDFGYFGDIVRGTETDMFLVYGQAVADIAVVFRPFYWGYLFLEPGRGLAFFWCGRWIALFMVSFEMFMLITKREKRLSLAGACLIALAPVVQWWFAINGLVEMLIFGQLSVILLHKYMNTEDSRIRAAMALVIFVCAGGFILAMYPAWEIPMAYVVLALGIWVILENIRNFRFRKRDLLVILILAILFLGIMFHIYSNSKETIDLFMNTAYPGARSETGGGAWKRFFNYFFNMWYALLGDGTLGNTSAGSQFIDFFPFCYIIPAGVLMKKKDKFLVIMFCAALFLGVYCVAGFPEILARVTLMSYSSAPRAFIVLGFVNILLLMRGLAQSEICIPKLAAAVAGIVAASGIYAISALAISDDFYPGIKYVVVTIGVFAILFALLLRIRDKRAGKIFCSLCVAVMVLAGALVNPVHLGIKPISDSELVSAIEDISEEDPDALWAVVGAGLPIINLPIMAGASTINSTNTYPVLERWEELDDTASEVYNRYAHIRIELKEEGSAEFELERSDVFTVTMNVSDLKELGVSYVLSARSDLESCGGDGVELKMIEYHERYYIYKVY